MGILLFFGYDRKLRSANKDNINFFSFDGKKITAKVVDIYDGDTITVVFRDGGRLIKHRVRLIGYDSPEMKPLLSHPNRQTDGTLYGRQRHKTN